MIQSVPCPSCQRRIDAGQGAAGDPIRCPYCGWETTPRRVPAGDVTEPALVAACVPTPPPLPPNVPPNAPQPPSSARGSADRTQGETSDLVAAADDRLAEPPPLRIPPHAAPSVGAADPRESSEPALPAAEPAWRLRWGAYKIGLWLAAAAVISLIPVLVEVTQRVHEHGALGMARWAQVLTLASGLQLVYAAYLCQLPDWSTLRVVSAVTLALAAGYAAALGALILARPHSQLVLFLELADAGPRAGASAWCLGMLVVFTLLAYASGRTSFRWQQGFQRWVQQRG